MHTYRPVSNFSDVFESSKVKTFSPITVTSESTIQTVPITKPMRGT